MTKFVRRIPTLILIVLVAGLAGAAQFIFDSDPARSNLKSIALLLLLIPAAGALVYREKTTDLKDAEKAEDEITPGPAVVWDALRAQPWRSSLGTLAFVAILFSALRAKEIENNWLAAFGWLAGVGLYIAACVPDQWRFDLTGWQKALRSRWVQVSLAIGVIAIGAFLRVYRLDLPNIGIEEDAASFGVDALRILRGEPLYLFGLKWFHDTPSIYGILQAGFIKILGANATGLGMLSAIQGILNILVLFLLVRRMFGPTWAFMVSALLAVAPYHLYYSRTGENDLVVPLFATATLYFLHRGMFSKRSLDYALAGVSFGIGMWWDYNNKSFQLIPIFGLILLYLFVTQRQFWKINYPRLGIFLVGIMLVLIPVWSALVRTGKLWLDWTHERSLLQHLDWARQAYGTSSLPLILLRQFEGALFGLNHINPRPFSAPYPMLNSITATLFFVGLAYSLWRWRDSRYGITLAWWFGSMQASIWSTDPPFSYRLVIALIPTYILVGIGLAKLLALWAKALNWNRAFYTGTVAALLLAGIGYTDISFYFDPQQYPSYWLHFTYIGQLIKDNVADHDVYLVGAPWVTTGWGIVQWTSQMESLKATDAENAEEIVPLKQVARDVMFIFVGGNYDDFDKIRQMYPGGVATIWNDPVHNLPDTLRIYEITRELASRPALQPVPNQTP